jgi:hypothetical protein
LGTILKLRRSSVPLIVFRRKNVTLAFERVVVETSSRFGKFAQ